MTHIIEMNDDALCPNSPVMVLVVLFCLVYKPVF